MGSFLADALSLKGTDDGSSGGAQTATQIPVLVCPRLGRNGHAGEGLRRGGGLLRQNSSSDELAGSRVRRMIVITQPRKLAAKSLAERVAEEWGCAVGEEVGYDTGADNNHSSKTIVKFVTDKVLLNEAIRDPQLRRYRVILVDEAHERTVDTDLILGRLKAILSAEVERGRLQSPMQTRPSVESKFGLRVVVMSATLDADLFSNFFTIHGIAPATLSVRTWAASLNRYK